MDKNKIIDKLLKKYPDLQEEPLFDELLSMDAEEEMGEEEHDDMGEAPDVEVEIKKGAEEEGGGEEDLLDDNEDAHTERAIEKAMFDSSNEPDMPKEAANSDDRLRELIKMRKKMKKA